MQSDYLFNYQVAKPRKLLKMINCFVFIFGLHFSSATSMFKVVTLMVLFTSLAQRKFPKSCIRNRRLNFNLNLSTVELDQRFCHAAINDTTR